MNIMELGAIGELVGGVAVIATLIYLAVQIRHSAESNLASTQFGIQSEYNRVHEMVVANPELLATLEMLATGEDLGPLQSRSFHHFAWRLVNQWMSAQVAYEHGSVDRLYFTMIKEDVGACCQQWPGLAEKARAILSAHSARPEVFELLYASQ